MQVDLKLGEETVSHIAISKDGNFSDPHDVPPSAPVRLCDQFKCMHVCIYLKAKERESENSGPPRTVSSMLMAASRERILPALLSSSDGKELWCDQKLYNDLIGMHNVFQF